MLSGDSSADHQGREQLKAYSDEDGLPQAGDNEEV